MITKIIMWYLRTRKKSVVINVVVGKGYIQMKSSDDDAYVYDNHLAVPVFTNRGTRAKVD